jgi:hypothetical protein
MDSSDDSEIAAIQESRAVDPMQSDHNPLQEAEVPLFRTRRLKNAPTDASLLSVTRGVRHNRAGYCQANEFDQPVVWGS